ncbi:MAG: type IX secretion system sortase PorU [Bacteroidales bacterium]|nr:type IX secretion system sortase PorU [Bacteroidales bacterium]
MRTRNVFILLLLFIPVLTFCEVQRYERNISWIGIQQISIAENEFIHMLRFEGSKNNYENNFLPVYYEIIPLFAANVDLAVSIVNEIYEPIPRAEIYIIEGDEKINNNIEITSGIAFDRKKPFATVSFIPLRKNELTGFYERLVFFELEITTTINNKTSGLKTFNYKENSVFATGNWYKIAVNKTGIHKISYQELSDLGVNVNNIDPRNIRLYGYGGGMLPEDINEFRYDDLPENAIYVKGESDGSFDSGDYVLFYGEPPDVWSFDGIMHKKIHLYSDYTYYYITTDLGEGKRIQTQPSSSLNPTFSSNKFNDGYHYELEETNLIGTGRIWYGETFDLFNNLIIEINFPDLDLNSKVYLAADVAARSDITSSFSISVNNVNRLTLPISATNSSNINSDYAKTRFDSTSFYVNSSDMSVKVVYSKPLSTSVGYLNYFKLNVIRNLSFNGSQMNFRDLRTATQEYVTEYTLSKANSDITIWNITDPVNVKKMGTIISGSTLDFRIQSDKLEEFVAFDGSSFHSPNIIGSVENQNLHGLGEYEMIIVTHPNFTDQAVRLANHHINYDGMSVTVTELQDIYNEFSSGSQDITAIRDYVKMLYDKASAGMEPKYLLLFGDGSYDMKDREENNTNFIPTWESPESLNPISSIVKDDFYGFLDGDNMVDIGIGRFVVSTVSQARNAVDKVIHYATNSDEVMGDWRNVICLIADDEDNNLHFNDAERHATNIDTTTCIINIDKIYLDAYEQVSSPSGEKYPKVTEDINNRVERGALFVNYIGHGGELGLAHERILKIADINSWNNYDNMPVFITATCEFSRFDDPKRTSAGEYVFLNPNGGGISLFTTSRATYAGANYKINKNFYNFALQEIDGEHLRMGDVIRLAKNASGNDQNTNKFVLLGDPALEFAFPKQVVITTKINDISILENFDTIKALSEVSISGEMQDYLGNKLVNFNGVLYPTVFDKPTRYTTLGNDPSSNQATFYIQKNPLYKGKASIKNGEWSFTFIVPKDIAYEYGFGKLSYYAKNDEEDAAGCFMDIIVGGYSENSGIDMDGPDIELYMCDEFFKEGGVTDENPDMLAFIEDESGINTVGSGIGHNIVATLDGAHDYILNDYYESDLDNYRKGTIRYPFYNLSDGKHTLSLKIWDIHNNPSTVEISFVVNGETEGFNYPNPFNAFTQFKFEHTYCEETLDVDIRIYALTGQLVKTIREQYASDCYVYISEPWDGTNDGGGKLAGGIYIYRIFVSNANGESLLNLSNKLIIID